MTNDIGAKSAPTLLRATQISHQYDYPLFHNLSLRLQAGESIAVVGVSGSGKSTLLHILSTMLPPQKGHVELLGEDVYALPEHSRTLLRRYKVGIIFQFHYLFKGMSAFENIEVATLLSQTAANATLFSHLGIEAVMHQRISTLSGGQQQRVSIARVLAKRPKLIFADEPTGNLDDATAQTAMDAIFGYIQEVQGGLFLVTHDHAVAKRCDHVYHLDTKGLVPLS